jgi:hypothetical protein
MEQIMPNTSKSSKKVSSAKAFNPAREVAETLTPVYLKGIQRGADLQKKSLDVAAEQANDWIAVYKKTFSYLPVAAPTFFFDLAEQVVENVVDTQKNVIDLFVEQSEAGASTVNERAEAYNKVAEGVAAAAQASVARSVEAQQKALSFAAEQSSAFYKNAKNQFGVKPVAAVVDRVERGTKAILEAQKSLIDVVAKPFVPVANA